MLLILSSLAALLFVVIKIYGGKKDEVCIMETRRSHSWLLIYYTIGDKTKKNQRCASGQPLMCGQVSKAKANRFVIHQSEFVQT